ncbi:MAG: hypothetical protein Q9190_007772 [Brigantiaea leucoxantha]
MKPSNALPVVVAAPTLGAPNSTSTGAIQGIDSQASSSNPNQANNAPSKDSDTPEHTKVSIKGLGRYKVPYHGDD